MIALDSEPRGRRYVKNIGHNRNRLYSRAIHCPASMEMHYVQWFLCFGTRPRHQTRAPCLGPPRLMNGSYALAGSRGYTTGTIVIQGPSIVQPVWRCFMFNGSYALALGRDTKPRHHALVHPDSRRENLIFCTNHTLGTKAQNMHELRVFGAK